MTGRNYTIQGYIHISTSSPDWATGQVQLGAAYPTCAFPLSFSPYNSSMRRVDFIHCNPHGLHSVAGPFGPRLSLR